MKVPTVPVQAKLPISLKTLLIPAQPIPVGPMFSNVLRPTPIAAPKPGMPATPQPPPALGPSKGEKPLTTKDDDLDPMARRAAQLAPPVQLGPTIAIDQPSAIVDTHARVSLEEILPALVRKIAWAGDGRKGSVRIELGAGELAGSTLLVHADDGKVRVELDVPAGVDATAWRDRIREKLTARGLDVESVEVR